MMEVLMPYYLWFKAFHVISVIAWMAGMFYLPRLYAYHAGAQPGSQQSETFKVMERRLLRIIMNPALISTWVFAGLLVASNPAIAAGGWFHAKMLLVIMMTGLHGAFAKWRKTFERDENTRPARFYKIWNEAPTVLMIVIVVLAVVKPF